MEKVHPITYDKKKPMTQPLSDRETTQLRGLLGSLQWPSAQTSPHLQCSTSLLAGQVTSATLQTVAECNKLLKFAKENKDLGLCYNHLGPSEKMRLLCFFDAGFSARLDGSSQGGYIIMMINEDLMHSAEEGEYHILDWRSFKTPRVSRSSLGAEAQAGGQASDAVDFACRYWRHLLEPNMPVRDLLKIVSGELGDSGDEGETPRAGRHPEVDEFGSADCRWSHKRVSPHLDGITTSPSAAETHVGP